MSTDEERAIDVEAGQRRVAQILNTTQRYPESAPLNEQLKASLAKPMVVESENPDGTTTFVSRPTRKPRSDKGVPKGPKQKQAAGVLTNEQVQKIHDLAAARGDAFAKYMAAGQARDAADKAWFNYLDELAGKRP